MKVDVGKHQYRITSDSRQYMLATYTNRKDKDGNDIVEYIGYYPKIDNLLVALLNKEGRLSEAKSLEQHIKEYRKIANDVHNIAKTMAHLVGNEAEFKKLLNKAEE